MAMPKKFLDMLLLLRPTRCSNLLNEIAMALAEIRNEGPRKLRFIR